MGRLTRDSPAIERGIMPQPYFKTPIVPTGSFRWGVTAKSRYQSEAVRFVTFVTSREMLTEFHLGIEQLPSRKSIGESVASCRDCPR